MTLLFRAICATPIEALEIAFPWEKAVIHREIEAHVIRPRHCKKRPLAEYCKCNKEGECLCYLTIIKNHFIDVAWHTEDDYRIIGDWIRDNHRN